MFLLAPSAKPLHPNLPLPLPHLRLIPSPPTSTISVVCKRDSLLPPLALQSTLQRAARINAVKTKGRSLHSLLKTFNDFPS